MSQYKANDRFMISVTKREDDDDFGIDLVEFQEGEIYVSRVHQGPFYETGNFFWILRFTDHVFSTLFASRFQKPQVTYNYSTYRSRRQQSSVRIFKTDIKSTGPW